MKCKKVVSIIFLICAVMSMMSCGSGENEENADTKKEVTESKGADTETTANEKNDSTERVLKDMTLDIESKDIVSVSIEDGNTGSEIKKIEIASDITIFVNRLNEVEFKAIETEPYSGWQYGIKIIDLDGTEINIVVTSNELINVFCGDESQYCRTDFDLVQYIKEVIGK